MNKHEIEKKLSQLADELINDSPASVCVLHSLAGAILLNQEHALSRLCANFSQQLIDEIAASRN